MTNAQDVIVRYLQDAIAAEKSSEAQLKQFIAEDPAPEAHSLLAQHLNETTGHRKELEGRLNLLNASPSAIKGLMTTLFGTAPKAAQVGGDDSGRASQNLVNAFAAENMEVAMYEALAIAAHEAGDEPTELLARRIQQEEKRAAEQIFALISNTAGNHVPVSAGAS